MARDASGVAVVGELQGALALLDAATMRRTESVASTLPHDLECPRRAAVNDARTRPGPGRAAPSSRMPQLEQDPSARGNDA